MTMRGVFQGYGLAEYLSMPEVDKSALDMLRRCPLDYWEYRQGLLKREVTPAMKWGALLHEVVLQDIHEYHVKPLTYPSKDGEKPWNANSAWCRDWLTDHADKPVLSQDEADELTIARRVILEDKLASALLAEAEGFEVSMFCDDADSPCGLKSRPDMVAPEFLVDLKSCTDCNTEKASRVIANLRYHVQAALYLRVCRNLGLQQKNFFFIFLQTSDPPRLNVRRLKTEAIVAGETLLEQDLQLLRQCWESNRWPGPSGDTGHIEDIDLPTWAYTQSIIGDDINLICGTTEVKL